MRPEVVDQEQEHAARQTDQAGNPDSQARQPRHQPDEILHAEAVAEAEEEQEDEPHLTESVRPWPFARKPSRAVDPQRHCEHRREREECTETSEERVGPAQPRSLAGKGVQQEGEPPLTVEAAVADDLLRDRAGILKYVGRPADQHDCCRGEQEDDPSPSAGLQQDQHGQNDERNHLDAHRETEGDTGPCACSSLRPQHGGEQEEDHQCVGVAVKTGDEDQRRGSREHHERPADRWLITP